VLSTNGKGAAVTYYKVGIVDDEAPVRETLEKLLAAHKFFPIPLSSADEFRRLREKDELDLVLIDLKLKEENGLSLAMEIRQTSNLPIVMLTGTGNESDKIVGLELVADDYILKPFNPLELVARIKAVLRRYGKQTSSITSVDRSDGTSFGHMTLKHGLKALVDRNENEVYLTNAEYRLLAFFLKRPNVVITRLELMAELGSDETRYIDRTIDVLILRLRRKIEDFPSKPEFLQTRRGQGYIFVTDPQNTSS